MSPRGGWRGGGRPPKSEAGRGVKKSILFSQEGAALIESAAAELGLTYADLIEEAVAMYVSFKRTGKPADNASTNEG